MNSAKLGISIEETIFLIEKLGGVDLDASAAGIALRKAMKDLIIQPEKRKVNMLKIKKEKYDYYYDRDGEPIITICYILTENGIVGRGISVCSKQDKYDDFVGKGLAKGHALRAIKGRHLDNFKRPEVIKLLIQTKCPFTKKGERNPDLSWWERKFLFGAKNMSDYIVDTGFVDFMTAGERGAAAGTKLRLELQRLHALKSRSTWLDKNYFSKLYHYPVKTINTDDLEKAIKDLSARGRLRL